MLDALTTEYIMSSIIKRRLYSTWAACITSPARVCDLAGHNLDSRTTCYTWKIRLEKWLDSDKNCDND